MDEMPSSRYLVYGVGHGGSAVSYVGMAEALLAGEAMAGLIVGLQADVFELESFFSVEEAMEALAFWRANFRFLGFQLREDGETTGLGTSPD